MTIWFQSLQEKFWLPEKYNRNLSLRNRHMGSSQKSIRQQYQENLVSFIEDSLRGQSLSTNQGLNELRSVEIVSAAEDGTPTAEKKRTLVPLHEALQLQASQQLADASPLPSHPFIIYLKSLSFKIMFYIAYWIPGGIRNGMNRALGYEAQMSFEWRLSKGYYKWMDFDGEASLEPFSHARVLEQSNLVKEKVVYEKNCRVSSDCLHAWVHYNRRFAPSRGGDSSKSVPSSGPIVIYIHGGGWSVGGPSMHHSFSMDLLQKLPSGSVVVNLYYRMGPEHRYPTAVDDVIRGIEWASEHVASRFGGDSNRMVIMGDSAGGNLSVAALLKLKNDSHFNQRINIQYQFLIYPAGVYYLHKKNRTPSAKKYSKNGYFIDEWMAVAMTKCYVPQKYQEDTALGYYDPYLSPGISGRFSNFPDTFLYHAQHDMLRSEGVELASKMRSDGVNVEEYVDEFAIHGQLDMEPERLATMAAVKIHEFFERNLFVE